LRPAVVFLIACYYRGWGLYYLIRILPHHARNHLRSLLVVLEAKTGWRGFRAAVNACRKFWSWLSRPWIVARKWVSEHQERRRDYRAFEKVAAVPAAPGIGRRASGNLIVMLVISDLRIDPRLEREARALAAAGWKVVILYPDTFSQGPAPTILHWGAGVSFERLPLEHAGYMMSFPGLNGTDYLRAALRHKPFAFHGHDLSTAKVALAAGNATGAHVVCDFHEWSSENVEWDYATTGWIPIKPKRKKVWRQTERRALASASAIITVCESIANDLEEEFGDRRKRIHVVRNIPDLQCRPTKEYPPLRQQYGVSDDAFLLLWQGGTGPGRLIEPIIESLKYVPGVVFIIRGPSLDLFGEGYKKLARQNGAADRLILAPPIPSQDVVTAARGADAGIWSLSALCKNFTYALPNKIFEYLGSGVPVLCADYPEARRVVEEYGVGLIFNPVDPRSIGAAIRTLKDEPARRARIIRRIPSALEELDAGLEWNKLVTIYDRLRKAKDAPVEMTALGRSIR